VLLAIEGMAEVVLRRNPPDAPTTTLWFALPAVATLVLAVFARRRAPFGALTGYWLLAATISFIDGRLIPFVTSLFAIGMAVSFLLGNLGDARRARIGLAVVGAGAVIRGEQRSRPCGQRPRFHPS
jgi:hypothetical protein